MRWKRALSIVAAISAASFASREASADSTMAFDGAIPDGAPDHFFIPFDVPAGTVEIEILHNGQPTTNILDFGVLDPNGYRGWGGGTSENSVIGEHAASRAFVPGPLPVGPWRVVVGKAKIVASPATYHVEVTFRTTATLAPQTDRKPYAAVAPLDTTARWYAMDLHAHSQQSTDARKDLGLDEMLDFAASRGLDALEISDHNTITQLDYFVDAQARHPHTLLIPGIEFTTYAGHANAIGATHWVDHKIGQPGVTIEGAADRILAQGALFSINHPALDLGNVCIGCAWKHPLLPGKVSAIEIQTGAYGTTGFIFLNDVLKFWEALLATGAHVPAVGGSDDHRAGVDEGQFGSTIGQPVTLVWAKELSVAALLDGIKNGRTVVKLQDIHDPMLELSSEVVPRGDAIRARSTFLRARVTGMPEETTVRFVKNGVPLGEIVVTTDPFDAELAVVAPATGEDRYRAEVLVKAKPRTIASHVFVSLDPAGPDAVGARASGGTDAGGGCDVTATSVSNAWLVVLGAAIVALRRLRRRAQ